MSKERTLLDLAARSLEDMANTLDDWAAQSRQGGWSTHQVGANIDEANKCRRNAAEIRRYLRSEVKP